ncbi:DNA polymerase-3 subunit alpha [Sporosarcina luteola]|nr:DNA polymerase-3 subunit alpha [Sporosarcina luteola]
MALVYPQLVTGADLLRGIIKLPELLPLLKERGAVAIGLVNSKMYGSRAFYKAIKECGIHPVLGLSIQLELSEKEMVPLYIYAKDDGGYRNLLKISSAVSIRQEETLPLKWLHAYSSGCIVVCPVTESSWDGEKLKTNLQAIQAACSPSSVCIGISRPGGIRHPAEEERVELAKDLGLPIAACHEARFIRKEDRFSYEVAEAIRFGYKLNDPMRPKFTYESAYLPAEEEWKAWFADRPDWLETTSELLLSCNAELPPSRPLMPVYPVPEGETARTLLEKRCSDGLRARLGEPAKDYKVRLEYELGIIANMGFSDYFLIVEDFMRYAKEEGILTGPGRGSSAGSLAAFSLGITDVDPIKYGLIFERFLNPGRVTMPDIDIDFADHRRSEVIEYVARKYGKHHVAQIITFGTLSAKSVARNVARVFDFSNEEMAFLSREIQDGQGRRLSEIVSKSTALQKWLAIDQTREKWLAAAVSLEGLPRNASTHAAGVVLSPTPLVETVPVQSGGENIYLTQWAMGDVEEQGLLKMDFLGLRNLTLMDRIRSMIEYDTGQRIDFGAIPLTDKKTFELFQKGDMTGVFQFESGGMRDALRLISPTRFEDLYAINALYRPGPMENIPLYSRRKKGTEQVEYIHPLLEPVLQETYGIIVYQEQIMQIAVQVAGFSMAEADLLRRAISKKKREILQQERLHFIQSAVSNQVPERSAAEIYDLIVKFADYGFPKSHAVAYSLISYQLAYLKANYTSYFYAALLSMATGNQEKIMELIREMKDHGISILPPSVSKSKYMHTVEKGAVRIGLGAVKGVTPTFYDALRHARRTAGRWKTLFDMAASIGGSSFQEKSIRPLIQAGALDEFGENRAVLLASIEAAKNHAVFVSPEGDDLLQDVIFSIANPKYTPAGTMPMMMKLESEREVLGFYLSEHPATELKKTISSRVTDIGLVAGIKEKTFVNIAGLLIDVKRIRTKKGEAMAFLKLQDESGEISCTCFPKQYASFSKLLEELSLLQLEGTIEHRHGQPQVLVQSVKKLG